jgi:hypothetical protein
MAGSMTRGLPVSQLYPLVQSSRGRQQGDETGRFADSTKAHAINPIDTCVYHTSASILNSRAFRGCSIATLRAVDTRSSAACPRTDVAPALCIAFLRFVKRGKGPAVLRYPTRPPGSAFAPFHSFLASHYSAFGLSSSSLVGADVLMGLRTIGAGVGHCPPLSSSSDIIATFRTMIPPTTTIRVITVAVPSSPTHILLTMLFCGGQTAPYRQM